MNWKSILFWSLVFAGLAYFFFSFASYLFDKQEETQLFIPQWDIVQTLMLTPGGICEILGLTCTQYYCIPLFAAIMNAALLSSIGICFYILLQKIETRGYHLIITLFPVAGLLKMHITFGYVVDGTIAILCMLSLLCNWVYIATPKSRIIFVIISSIMLYWIAGQMVILYSILLFVLSLILKKNKIIYPLLSIVLSAVLVYIDTRYLLNVPITKGFYSPVYHNSQIQADSLIYYTWIRFSLLLLLLFIICKLMGYITWKGKLKKIMLTVSVGIIFLFYSSYFLPNAYDIQNRMMDQLSYLSRRKQWDTVIRMHTGKKLPGSVNRNYLNMALAQKGVLGDQLFHFDQHGPSGLLSPYNGTYYMSILLSDIHFYLGDISISESYAMEALTLSRRRGSPRALQRLVQVNLIKKEFGIAGKYLSLLERMPCYKTWARQNRTYLTHPGKCSENKELPASRIIDLSHDTLLSLMTIDSLWRMHVEDSVSTNRIAMEYVGCSYLLAKNMEAFKIFFSQITEDPKWQSLPIHFQEAAIIFDMDSMTISPAIRQRYEDYRKAVAEAKRTSKTAALQPFGDTFWFYYQFKELDAKRANNINTQKSVYD